MRIVICTNTAWNIVNFRNGLIRALRAAGHEVIAIAGPDNYSDRLSAMVDRYIPLPMDSRGTNPLRDALLLIRFIRVLRRLRPDVFLGYTIKPNIYGSIACQWLGIATINNVSGLGATFMRPGFLNTLVRNLYRTALSKSRMVFFQNQDDHDLFVGDRLVRPAVAHVIPGSGIDLQRFVPLSMPLIKDPTASFRFLLMARLLWDKGVGEFVEAARFLKPCFPNTEFCLLGSCDVENPAAISRAQVQAWEEQGLVRYLGQSDHVVDEIAKAHCVVLPSYREGTPRSLLEAAACARPVIATDVSGCREALVDGDTGFLCQSKNAQDLADKMAQMMAMSPDQLRDMGLRGRRLMEGKFNEKLVIDRYLKTLAEISAC